jgi:hypothetical protein
MLWEGRPLRELLEADIRAVVDAGLKEHLQLEYKSALYEDNERGRREFLLDVCMFANTAGGILLIGVPELRAENGQATGAPDPAAPLGVTAQNPEAVLAAYDARVMEAIEERLALESAPVAIGDGRHVLVIRVPNSTRKPHSVRHERHVYFTARRERQRYHLSVREIKELVMRTASKLEEAQRLLENSFVLPTRRSLSLPYLIIGIVPIFFEEFLVDVRIPAVREAIALLNRGEQPQWQEPTYTFEGLERREDTRDYIVTFRRNGLLTTSVQVPLYAPVQQPTDQHVIVVATLDLTLRRFVQKARAVYEAAGVSAPYALGMALKVERPLASVYGGPDGFVYNAATISARQYKFPFMELDDFASLDRDIRPLCDHVHQTFGRERSPNFNDEDAWIARYP